MRYCLVILFSLLSSWAFAQERWAIVVGISEYPTSSGWCNINGANDINIIVPMLQRNGFAPTHITTLANDQATKGNIKNAIIALSNKVKDKDIVYFHFSGHGQLITDINGDEGNKGWDESLIPYDADFEYRDDFYKGEKHIVDDELNEWLTLLKNKIGNRGKLIVVLDACHSGGGSRYETDDNIIIRGVNERFILPQPTEVLTTYPNEIRWVCISACKWVQSNEEYLGYGRLSYTLNKVFDKSLTIEQLESAIKLQYDKMPKKNSLPQEPLVEYNCSPSETIM